MILELIYKSRHNLLPVHLQSMFYDRLGRNSLRGKNNFGELKARTIRKSFV